VKELREAVARAIVNYCDPEEASTYDEYPAAIRATIEALAAEADRFRLDVRHAPTGERLDSLSDWLRSHLPASDPEVGDSA
jgi:hypothetical protein